MTSPRPELTRSALRVVPPGGDERQLPVDLDAEQATLGALISNRDAIVAIGPWLRADHFYLEKHGIVYDAVRQCYRRGVPPDLRTIADALHRMGWLEAIGGIPFLVMLAQATPTSVHVEYYAQIVERLAMLRRLIQAGGTIAALGYEVGLEDAERVAAVQAAIQGALARPGLHGAASATEVAGELFAFLTAETTDSIPTGLQELDALLDGLQRGDLLLLAGRPGMGKTSFALQVLANVSSQGQTALMFSLEMSRLQLMQRIAASHLGLNLMALRQRTLNDQQIEQVVQTLGEISKRPFFLDDSQGLTLDELRIKASALQTQLALEHRQLDLIIVDYLQLMVPPEAGRRARTRTEDVSALSRGLKQLARELQVPIIALCQLNRGPESRADHVPMLADLRDSGSLEQDADIVLFLYREEVYTPETPKQGLAEVHVAKHRNGPVGVAVLRYEAATQRWSDHEQRRQPEGY